MNKPFERVLAAIKELKNPELFGVISAPTGAGKTTYIDSFAGSGVYGPEGDVVQLLDADETVFKGGYAALAHENGPHWWLQSYSPNYVTGRLADSFLFYWREVLAPGNKLTMPTIVFTAEMHLECAARKANCRTAMVIPDLMRWLSQLERRGGQGQPSVANTGKSELLALYDEYLLCANEATAQTDTKPPLITSDFDSALGYVANVGRIVPASAPLDTTVLPWIGAATRV